MCFLKTVVSSDVDRTILEVIDNTALLLGVFSLCIISPCNSSNRKHCEQDYNYSQQIVKTFTHLQIQISTQSRENSDPGHPLLTVLSGFLAVKQGKTIIQTLNKFLSSNAQNLHLICFSPIQLRDTLFYVVFVTHRGYLLDRNGSSLNLGLYDGGALR